MPANEQTWRSPKLMHTVFAVSSILMLVTTIWMLADDHNRPWKDYQRNFINLDSWTTQARIADAESADYEATLHKLQDELNAAQATFTAADEANVEKFLVLEKQYAADFASLLEEYKQSFSVSWSESASNECLVLSRSVAASKDPKDVKEGRAKLLDKLRALLARAQFREDHFVQDTKEKRADFSAAQSQFDQAVGQGRPADELTKRQAAVDAANAAVDISVKLTSKAIEQRKGLEDVLKAVTAAEDKAQKALDDNQQKVNNLRQALKEHSLNFGKDLLTMPILDGFNGPLKDANRWLPQLPWNVNFKWPGSTAVKRAIWAWNARCRASRRSLGFRPPLTCRSWSRRPPSSPRRPKTARGRCLSPCMASGWLRAAYSIRPTWRLVPSIR